MNNTNEDDMPKIDYDTATRVVRPNKGNERVSMQTAQEYGGDGFAAFGMADDKPIAQPSGPETNPCQVVKDIEAVLFGEPKKVRAKRKRHYVSNDKQKILYLSSEQTDHYFDTLHVSCIGPFRTKVLAQFFIDNASNPHMHCVVDAVRMYKQAQELRLSRTY